MKHGRDESRPAYGTTSTELPLGRAAFCTPRQGKRRALGSGIRCAAVVSWRQVGDVGQSAAFSTKALSQRREGGA
jgi:hypothetical protein